MTRLRFDGRDIPVGDSSTVLEALEVAGETVPSACRAGACQSCLLRVTGGDLPAEAQRGLGASKRRLGYFLACQCRVTPGLELDIASDAVGSVSATITEVERLSGGVLRVRLACAEPLAYRAGQFVTVIRDDGLARPYSLASLPGDDTLELHVRHFPDGAMSDWLAREGLGQAVTLRGPHGECFYTHEDDCDRPLLLAGTGTGLAPLFGILRDALRAEHDHPITVIHGARTTDGLYLQGELRELARSHPNVELVFSVLEEPRAHSVVRVPIDELAVQRVSAMDAAAMRAYLCGDPALVNDLRRQLFLAGVPLGSIAADAFVPAASS